MKLYTIEKAEVKTIYEIELTAEQIPAIVAEACENDLRGFLWKSRKLDLSMVEHMDENEVVKAFFKLWAVNHTRDEVETIDFIVRYILGFDGVENYGGEFDNSHTIKLVVYKYGDKIN